QLLGTDCGRNLIHPNIWINALMSDYKPNILKSFSELNDNDVIVTQNREFSTLSIPAIYPNWIISDVRFPNEVKSIKDKEGIILRVTRPGIENNDNHSSETALDDYKEFDWVLNNDADISTLIEKVKIFLQHFNIIK